MVWRTIVLFFFPFILYFNPALSKIHFGWLLTELDQKKVNYVDRFARFSLCASESGYPGVGEIKKKKQEFRKSYEIYLRKWEILSQGKKKNKISQI